MRLKPIFVRRGCCVWLERPANSREVGLRTRTNEANSRGVDLYWSIHANAGGGSGVCAFYWHTSENGRKLARMFAEEMKKAGFNTHGDGTHASKPGSWTSLHVTRETRMTSKLTEKGFMDNAEDFKGIFGRYKEEYRQRVAETHAKIICRYFGVSYKGVKSASASASSKKEGPRMWNPTSRSLKESAINAMREMTNREKYGNAAISQSWVEKAEKGELTMDDAAALGMYIARHTK